MFSTLNVPVELHDAVIHKFEGGGIGTISSASAHLGTNTNTHQVTVHVVGNERQFSIDLNRSYVYVHYANGLPSNRASPQMLATTASLALPMVLWMSLLAKRGVHGSW